jgi:hypothetical protein
MAIVASEFSDIVVSGDNRESRQRVCFAIALGNGRDTILKERLFGLAGKPGRHGEDAKEGYP